MAVFGIDLGTTNSLIGLESTGYLSNLIPSCVNMETGEAGASMFDNMSAERSYKVNMSMGVEGIVPRVASQHVLEELARMAHKETGLDVKDVVISVPAYFSDSQRTATITAATLAGLNVVSLVNEPTAAAMYIAKNKKNLFVVYDLGGGTFDCSIIDSRFGTYDVQATSGRNEGGDNFDQCIMQYFIKNGNIPFSGVSSKMARTALQHFAGKVKIKLQQAKTPITVDLSPWSGETILFTPEVYKELMKMTFSKTIECMLKLIKAWIPDNELFEILLVGGSTHCPYLREWIEESTGRPTAPLTYDPDRVVAQGAALYADIVDSGNIATQVSDVTKELSIGLFDGTVSTIVPANSKIPLSVEKVFSNPVPATQLILDLYQGESMFVKDNECIGHLVWDYDGPKDVNEGQVIVTVSIDTSGVITFAANELLKPAKIVVLKRDNALK
jgi:molecular chaperone DnaK (HSP70)